MITEALAAIAEVEKKAEKEKKAAEEEAVDRIEKAEVRGREIIDTIELAAKKEVEKLIEKKKKEGEKEAAKIIEKGKDEADEIKKKAMKKIDASAKTLVANILK